MVTDTKCFLETTEMKQDDDDEPHAEAGEFSKPGEVEAMSVTSDDDMSFLDLEPDDFLSK